MKSNTEGVVVPVLVIHGGQHLGDGHLVVALPDPLQVTGAHPVLGQALLTAHGPLLADELVLITPVLKRVE